jgi:hypothetical protein
VVAAAKEDDEISDSALASSILSKSLSDGRQKRNHIKDKTQVDAMLQMKTNDEDSNHTLFALNDCSWNIERRL